MNDLSSKFPEGGRIRRLDPKFVDWRGTVEPAPSGPLAERCISDGTWVYVRWTDGTTASGSPLDLPRPVWVPVTEIALVDESAKAVAS